jgi:phosphatidate cytidylyltransferase
MPTALRTFFARLGSTLTLWSLCGATVFWAWEWGFWAMLLLLVFGALTEFFGLLQHAGLPHFRAWGIGWGTLSILGVLWTGRCCGTDAAVAFSGLALAVGCCIVFCAEIFGRRTDGESRGADLQIVPVALTLLGLVYVPFLGSFLAHLLYLTPRQADGSLTGHVLVFYLIMVTKFSDCGAYVVGSLFGKHPMIPRVSPKKTWEGFAGALLIPAVLSWGLFQWMPTQLAPLQTPVRAALLGVGLALLAVLGDLAESVLKRATGSKDSGRFLPGIGGALDLLDSLLFTAPVFYCYLRHFAL